MDLRRWDEARSSCKERRSTSSDRRTVPTTCAARRSMLADVIHALAEAALDAERLVEAQDQYRQEERSCTTLGQASRADRSLLAVHQAAILDDLGDVEGALALDAGAEPSLRAAASDEPLAMVLGRHGRALVPAWAPCRAGERYAESAAIFRRLRNYRWLTKTLRGAKSGSVWSLAMRQAWQLIYSGSRLLSEQEALDRN